MKKALIFCFLLLSNLFIAQSISTLKIRESTAYKSATKTSSVIAMYISKLGVTGVVTKGKKGKLLFEIFDKNLNTTFSEVAVNTWKEKHVGDLFYNNRLKLFTVYSPKKDERTLYCYTLD